MKKKALKNAFYYIEKKLIPLFLRQEKKRIRKSGGRR
jgi:hypothetical protein